MTTCREQFLALFSNVCSNFIYTSSQVIFFAIFHNPQGVTSAETVKTWAYSLHTCNSIVRDLNEIRDKEPPSAQTHHKEEMTHRMKNDEKDRKELHNKLEVCINPLHPEQHMCCEHCHRGICDLSSSPCDNAIQEGKKQIALFEGSWSAGFHTKIFKK